MGSRFFIGTFSCSSVCKRKSFFVPMSGSHLNRVVPWPIEARSQRAKGYPPVPTRGTPVTRKSTSDCALLPSKDRDERQ